MKIKPGSPIGAAPSGSVGALTACHGRSGYYLRRRVIGANRNTRRQQTVRAIFTTLVNMWRSRLSEPQRTAWNIYADNVLLTDRLGQTIKLTGQNHYLRSNSPRLLASLPRVLEAPIIFNTGNPPTRSITQFSATPDAIGLSPPQIHLFERVQVAGATSFTGTCLIYLSRRLNLSATQWKGPYQLTWGENFAAGITNINMTVPFTSFLSDNGDLVEDERRAIRIVNTYDDGRLSEPYQIVGPVLR